MSMEHLSQMFYEVAAAVSRGSAPDVFWDATALTKWWREIGESAKCHSSIQGTESVCLTFS